MNYPRLVAIYRRGKNNTDGGKTVLTSTGKVKNMGISCVTQKLGPNSTLQRMNEENKTTARASGAEGRPHGTWLTRR
jgi:hypothetical protein